jgi:hypothetical protein
MSLLRFVLTLMFQGVIPMLLGLGGGQFLGQAQGLENAASQTAGQFGTNAATQGSMLQPFFAQEMRAKHAYDPTQVNEMLTSAEGGAGGAFGGAEGEIEANAARTGNATTLAKTLDEMARNRGKAAAGASEGIAAQDVMGAKQLNQEGAAGMQGLYGTNVGAQLGAMKQAASDVQLENEMKPATWLSQLDQMAKFGGDIAKDITNPQGFTQG